MPHFHDLDNATTRLNYILHRKSDDIDLRYDYTNITFSPIPPIVYLLLFLFLFSSFQRYFKSINNIFFLFRAKIWILHTLVTRILKEKITSNDVDYQYIPRVHFLILNLISNKINFFLFNFFSFIHFSFLYRSF